MKTYRMTDLERDVFKIFPFAQIEFDNDGMIIIYTNRMAKDEGPEEPNPEVIPFTK